MGDRQQPPLDEDESTREPFGVVDLESCGVGRVVGEREGRVRVGSERAVGVEADAPRPAEDADVEVEDPSRVTAREEDRESGDDGRQHEADPEDDEDDEVRDREQPLEEPLPAAQRLVELAGETKRVRAVRGHGDWCSFRGYRTLYEDTTRTMYDAVVRPAVLLR